MRAEASKLVLSASVIVSLISFHMAPAFAAPVSQAATAPAAATETREQEKMITVGTVKTTSGNLNVRASAGLSAKIIGKLPSGTTVVIEKTQTNWHHITYGYIKGWVSADYIVNISKKAEKEVNRGVQGTDREKAQAILDYAVTLLGKPYKAGGSSPSGFDCSGYVSYVFKNFGITVPRPSKDYPAFGQKIPRSEMLPGDIICSDTTGKIDGGVSHVGIYMGDGKFIHAASGGKRQIMINSLSEAYYDKRFVCAVRVLN